MADKVEDVARYFDRAACCSPRRKDGRVRGVSRVLLRLLEDAGVRGRSVLDAGCGQGSVAVAVAQRGAGVVTGVDVSSQSIAVARRSARAADVSARFTVGDVATAALEPHDIVVLDKVVCCYVDAMGLLANAQGAARRVLALSLPHSRGLRGAVSRVAVAVENVWHRLRRDPFRAFVHDVDSLSRPLADAGFEQTARRSYGIWLVVVFERRS